MSRNTDNSWLVQRTRDTELVPADRWRIDMSGALVFTNGTLHDDDLVVAIAPHDWLTVVPMIEHDEDCPHHGDAG